MPYLICFLVIALLPACDHNPHTGPVLTVMTYNMGNDELPAPTTEQLVQIVRKNGVPDILLVQEVPWKVTIKDLAEALGFPYFVSGRTESCPNHIGILSNVLLCNEDRIHFESHADFPLPTALCAQIEVDHKKVLLCTVHLRTLSPELHKIQRDGKSFFLSFAHVLYDEMFGDTFHSRSVEKLLEWIKSKQHDAVIIGGNFNTFPLSKPIRAMNRSFNDALWPSMDYFVGTKLKTIKALGFPKDDSVRKELTLPINPRLDYLFHSENIDCLEAEVIQETAGDHYPVRAVLGLLQSN